MDPLIAFAGNFCFKSVTNVDRFIFKVVRQSLNQMTPDMG